MNERRARPRALALGILAVPVDRATRRIIRETWLQDRAFASGRAVARFVIGSAPCAHEHVDSEQRKFGDVVFVNASDCEPWHAGHKVHEWYKYALRHLPARWYGKVEDDSLVNVGPLLRDLAALRDARLVHVYGINVQWIAHCRQHKRGDWTRASAANSCALGCWLGRLAQNARPPNCDRGFDGSPIVPGSAACPSLPTAPFAPGPLEVRSAAIAAIVAKCRYADEYFSSLVARGALIKDECASTDGSQGHAIGECAAERFERLLVADASPHRQAYASGATFNTLRRAANLSAAGRRLRSLTVASELTVVHPIKRDRLPETWRSLWHLLEPLAVRPSTGPGNKASAALAHRSVTLVSVDLGRVTDRGRRTPIASPASEARAWGVS